MKLNKERSKKIALKIDTIFELIKEFTDEEIEYLRLTKKEIEKETSNLRAIGGVLVDLDKADAKIALGGQAISRIDGLLKIWHALRNTPIIQMDYHKKQIRRNVVDRMFGL